MVTRSGRVLRTNRSMSGRLMALKEGKAFRKVDRMSGLPKSRLKRLIYRLDPKRQAEYWFSRDGAIMALKVAGIAIMAMFVLTLGVFAYFRKDLPQVKDISGGNNGGSISYYDRTGQTLLWQDYNAVKRIPVPSNQLPNYLKEATVAIEDRDFYNHRGFDLKGIARAAVNDLFRHGGTQGGSTITQQLVKLNEDWTQQRSITRKVKELILAVELERSYTKDEILTGYLNAAPYGGVDNGAQTASQDYFHKDAKDLNLAQSAMLASIPKSPSAYSPYSGSYFDKNAFLARQHYVLDLMAQRGNITKAQAEAAKKEDVLAEVQPRQLDKYAGIKAPYFVLAAKNELENRFTCNSGSASCNKVGGWKVITTLDLNLQNKAEDLVASNLPNVQRLTGGAADEEATVAENVPTGQIYALVGGTNFSDPDHGQNNYAAGILIPPGSSFKPYDYTTLINNNNNVGAGSVLYDQQGPIPGYPCTNKALPKNGGNCLEDYDFIYPGPLTLRYALGGSRNVPAVKAMLSAVPNDTSAGHTDSIDKVISTASAMMANPSRKTTYNCYADEQLTQTTQCYGASAIGDGAFLHLDDHVNGLATLGRLGQAIPRTYLLELQNSSGKSIYKWKQPKADQVVKADAAYIVDNMASDPSASYLPGSCSATTCTTLRSGGYKFQRDNGWDFAVKTGTTNNGFDGLMTSWSTQFAVVSWVGNHGRNVDLSKARGAAMETLTEPITRGVMEAAHDGLKVTNWTQPATVKSMPAFVVRNHIHYGDIEPSPTNDLFPGWYVGTSGGTHSSQTIDKVSGAAATSCTPSLAKDTVGNGNAASWNIDIFNGGVQSVGGSSSGSTTTTATDTVHSCSDDKPSVTLTVNDSTATGVPNTTCTGTCTFVATASASSSHPLYDTQYASAGGGYINFLVDGQVVNKVNFTDTDSTTQSYKYTVSSPGTVSVSAQVVDSVLYDTTSDPISITTAAAATGAGANNNGNNGGHGGGNGFISDFCAKHPSNKSCRLPMQSGFFAHLPSYMSTIVLRSYLGLF